MYAWAESYAAARSISIALTETDSTKALSGVKEILDRSKGKAKERVDVEHRYSKLKDEEIDALLESKFEEVARLARRSPTTKRDPIRHGEVRPLEAQPAREAGTHRRSRREEAPCNRAARGVRAK
jgi:hypothetical protein